MNNILNLILPGQPIAKQRVRRGHNSAWYNPQADMMHSKKIIVKNQLPEGFIIIKKNIPVWVSIYFFFKPAKHKLTKKFIAQIKSDSYPYIIKPDRDNCDKWALDILSKIVFEDDNQVYAGSLYKYYSMNPRTEIEIRW